MRSNDVRDGVGAGQVVKMLKCGMADSGNKRNRTITFHFH